MEEDAAAGDDDNGEKPTSAKASAQRSSAYDPYKREPQFANARNTGLWELVCVERCEV